jgi:methylase of polypeptide subunit release factors
MIDFDIYKKFTTPGKFPLTVFYTDVMQGGGLSFGPEYVQVIREHYGDRVFDRAYEWCAGPGFIGYSLLATGICKELTLTDVYHPSIIAAEETRDFELNWCHDKNLLSIYLLKDLDLLPVSETWDLIVSNPPHFPYYVHYQDETEFQENRISTDFEWRAHKNFFANMKTRLRPGGIILLLENMAGSTPETFEPWITEAGLKITGHWKSSDWQEDNPSYQFYYLEIQHQ